MIFALKALASTGVLEKYRWALPRDQDLEIPYFSENNELPYPIGKKGDFVQMEEPIRWKFPQIADYAGAIKKYKEEHNVEIIGDGIIAPPPCHPQPICRMWEGSIPEPLLLLKWSMEEQRSRKRHSGQAFLFQGISPIVEEPGSPTQVDPLMELSP